MNHEEVYQALIAQLRTVASLPLLQLENTIVQTQGSTPFTRASMIFSRPSQLTVGVSGRDLHRGLLQVDVFVPLNTKTSVANELADKIIEAFPRTTSIPLTDGRLNVRAAYRETSNRINDEFHQVPVVVEWQTVV